MVPGKSYTPEDFVRIGWRRKWQFIVPAVVIAAGTAGVSRTLPDLYRSETLILVVPQRIPESFVQSTVTSKIEDRLQSIGEQVRSRTRLERIILEFDLYKELRQAVVMENVVARMNRDITIDTVKGDSFRVSYVSHDPPAAMKVTQRLASLFIEENLRDREVLAEGTNRFLESQLDDARNRLLAQEKKVEDYRRLNATELPTQLQSNFQLIQTTRVQLQSLGESIGKDRDRQLALERQMADANVPESAEQTARPTAAGDSGLLADGTPLQQLQTAQALHQSLRAKFTPEHPDMIQLEKSIRDLQQQVDASPRAVRVTPAPTPAELMRRNRQREMQAEMENLARQVTVKQTEEQRLIAELAALQARIDMAPTRESELIALTRDYRTLQDLYTGLLSKSEASKMSADLERRQVGEQFKVLDAAQVPERPFSPDRQRINILGALGGLALGLAFVTLLEYRDTSLRTDEDVTVSLSLPVLAMIPMAVTSDDRRRSKRRILVACSATVVFAGAAIAAWTLGS
jgi:polysaccharide chain length determinant protein (PEP-CTERM system associated)